MKDIVQELRHSVRSLLKQPGFTAVVVLTLALGIGINTAVFSVVDAVLFRPLPFERSDRLVDLYQQTDSNSVSLSSLPYDQIQTWRNQADIFQRVEAYSQTQFTMTGGGEPESVPAVSVTPGLFPMLGVAPARGRLFSAEEATTGNDRVVLLSDTFWRTRFGGDPAVVGKTVTLSDQRFTVVGVMPPKFKFPRNVIALWVPLVPPIVEPGKRAAYFDTLARLKDGVSVAVAQSRLDALKVSLTKDRPDVSWGIKLMPLEDHRVNRRPRQALLALLGAVGFVLLLSCANAANLLLARAATRQSEIAIRMVMGAGRSRLVRQLLAESLLLAAFAGVVGVAFAWLGVDALARLVPNELTFMSVAKIDIDPRVLLFSLAVTLMTGLLFGLVPALRATRPNLASVLGGTGGKTTADRSHNRLRHALIVLEVGLSLVLLIGAGLMIRSFLGLSHQKLGFEPKNLIAATIQLAEHRYPNAEAQRAFAARVVEVMSSAPGVEAMTLAGGVPPSQGGIQFDLDIEIEGHDPIAKDKNLVLPFNRVDSAYFHTLQIPIRRGRGFRADDASNPERLMIVNEAMARHFWPNGDPIGARIRFGKDSKWMRVVGVAGDVRSGLVASELRSMSVYYPAVQDTGRLGQFSVILRTSTDAGPLVAAMKSRLQSIDKDQPIYRIDTVEERLSDSLSEPRFYLQLLTVFAALTLLLVAMGLYGVMAHAVAQRTREIGIRQAVGAERRDILGLVLKRGLGLTGAGIVVGVVAALSMSKVMAAFLFGAPATDPQTYVLVGVLMTAVAAAACWVPALRATKVDPLTALRHD